MQSSSVVAAVLSHLTNFTAVIVEEHMVEQYLIVTISEALRIVLVGITPTLLPTALLSVVPCDQFTNTLAKFLL